MTNLDAVEADADREFWYEPVGTAVLPCSANAAKKIVSPIKKHSSESGLQNQTAYWARDHRHFRLQRFG